MADADHGISTSDSDEPMKPRESAETRETNLARIGRALRTGKVERARKIYDAGRGRLGRDRMHAMVAARLFAEAGATDEAAALVREAFGASRAASLAACRQLREAGLYAVFDRLVERVLRDFPNAEDLLTERMRACRDRGEIKKALDLAAGAAAKGTRSTVVARLAAQLARREGETERGLALLDALSDPDLSDELIAMERLRALEAIGDGHAALSGAAEALQRFPESGRVAVAAARIFRDAGQLQRAADLLSAIGISDAAYANARVALAFLHIEQSMAYAALEIADALEETETGTTQLSLAAARIRYRAGDAFGALETLRCLDHLWELELETGLLAATVLWRTGHLADATRLLERLRGRFPDHCEPVARLAVMLASLGRVAEARAAVTTLAHSDAQARARRIEAEIAISLEEGDLERARDLRQASIASAEAPGANHAQLGLFHLLNGEIKLAQASLREALNRNRGRNLAIGRSMKLARSFYGQFCNELAIDAELSETALALARAPTEQGLKELAHLAAEHPGQLAPGLAAAIALRKLGFVLRTDDPARANARTDRIPHRIVTYWDRDPPPEVLMLRKRIELRNSGAEVLHFDDAAARAFLSHHGLSDALRAYRLARVPARKADLFRLAFLWIEGGIYMDSDDLCTGPLVDLLPAGARLVVQQEQMLSTIGNNFLAAEARHPTIGWALEAAAEDILAGAHGIWFTTGPGMMTRAFAATALDPETGRPREEHHVLTRSRMLSRIVSHIPLRYKRAGLSWLTAEESAAEPATADA